MNFFNWLQSKCSSLLRPFLESIEKRKIEREKKLACLESLIKEAEEKADDLESQLEEQ